MESNEGRRSSDRWLLDRYDTITQRLAAIETAQRIYRDEVSSITQSIYKELQETKGDVKGLNRTVYGGEDPGILENIRTLMWKFGIATTAVVTIGGFLVNTFTPAIKRVVDKVMSADEDPAPKARKRR
jgi:hypothetical protein